MRELGILTLLLLITVCASADTANLFDAKGPSAESMWVGIESCMETMEKSLMAAGNQVPKFNVRLSYCGCMVDAANAKVKLNLLVSEKCMNRAIRVYLK